MMFVLSPYLSVGRKILKGGCKMAQDEENMNAGEEEYGGEMDTEKSYDESDIEKVYSKGDFNSWDEIVDWLEKSGETDMDLTPEKAKDMTEDFRKLSDDGVEFTKNPHDAFGLVQGKRAETMS